MRRAALHSLMKKKIEESTLIILDAYPVSDGKTREGVALVETLAGKKLINAGKTKLVIVSREAPLVERSFRNIVKLNTRDQGSINTLDMLKHKYIIGTEEWFANLK
jgi:ribosomal protein L4